MFVVPEYVNLIHVFTSVINLLVTRGNSLRVSTLSGILVQSVHGVQLFVPYLGIPLLLIPSIVSTVGDVLPIQDITDRVLETYVLQLSLSVDEGATSYNCNPFRVLRVIAEITRILPSPHPRSLSVSAGWTRIYPTRVFPSIVCLLFVFIRCFSYETPRAGDWPLQSIILPTGFPINAHTAENWPEAFPLFRIGGGFKLYVETITRVREVTCFIASCGNPRSLSVIANRLVFPDYSVLVLKRLLSLTKNSRYYSLTVIPYKEDRLRVYTTVLLTFVDATFTGYRDLRLIRPVSGSLLTGSVRYILVSRPRILIRDNHPISSCRRLRVNRAIQGIESVTTVPRRLSN